MSDINLYGVSPFKTPLKLADINFDNHHLIGFSWPYTNSQGKTYHTTMTNRAGFAIAPDLIFMASANTSAKYTKGL